MLDERMVVRSSKCLRTTSLKKRGGKRRGLEEGQMKVRKRRKGLDQALGLINLSSFLERSIAASDAFSGPFPAALDTDTSSLPANETLRSLQ